MINIILFESCEVDIYDKDSKELVWYAHNIKNVALINMSELKINEPVPTVLNTSKKYEVHCKNKNIIYQFVICTLKNYSKKNIVFNVLKCDTIGTLYNKIFMEE